MTIEGRPTIARHRDSTIMVITEQTPDDTWTAVSTVTRETSRRLLVERVPLIEGPAAEFATEAQARD